MSKMKWSLIVACLVLVGVYVFNMWILGEHFRRAPKREESVFRQQCRYNQSVIYTTLRQYKEKTDTIPNTLEILINEEYISKDRIFCPQEVDKQKYMFFPEHFGEPNKVLITESPKIHHPHPERLSTTSQPVQISTMGDGKIKEEIVEKAKQ